MFREISVSYRTEHIMNERLVDDLLRHLPFSALYKLRAILDKVVIGEAASEFRQ